MKIRADTSGSLPKHLVSGSMIVAGIVVIALMVLGDFWLSTRSSNVTFVDWIREDWLGVSIRATIIVGAVAWYLGTRQSVWQAMYADYSTVPTFSPQSTSYTSAVGILRIDEEEYEISTTPIEAGLVLSRPDGESLFFPWMKVKEIRVLNQSPDIARVEIRRRTAIPLQLEVPWSEHFRDQVPSELKYFGAE